MFGLPRTYERPRNVRLDTLIRLRWLAVFGQFAAVLVVHFGLEFEVPIWPCLAVIALAALLNVALRLSFHHTQWLEPARAAWLLAFDTAELAALLYLTGGLENPFAFLLLGPVLISATALPPRITLLIGTFAMLCATALVFLHYDLPWDSEDPLELPEIYMVGVWLSILLAIGYIGVYTWQVAEEARQLSDALAATELVLAREQHLSQLDGLAAAAAHELGTPLATITVVVRELERALEANSPYSDDVKLLREQAQRCREILAKITELPTADPFERSPLSVLLEEAVAPHRNFGVAIGVTYPPNRSAEPRGARNPAIRYGLGNLIENAVDFAHSRVEIFVAWTGEDVSITISDDGPGFSPEIIDRIGSPYVSHRKQQLSGPEGEENTAFGLGLGFFIAKTLLERSGAKLALVNQSPPLHGATVTVTWNRSDFERPLAPSPLETAIDAS
ncbi:MAG TPA: ActS/PrrB/RegB family redox-sensitive histidine kinase [Xanthobacteraceae bacterium]|jgi:two-component system sensor histidine kinase RegB|nr:ActS/PrrB/RegB family redox-sensitive histidine kinase [Xanthobacteraceae bacterium]